MDNKVRLSKLMSEQGISSRREADALIEKGLVIVDGKVVDTLGTKVDRDAKISLKKEGQNLQDQKLTILLNKPLGYVSCQPEDGYKEALDLIREENRDKKFKTNKKLPPKLIKFAVAGRLDINSKGLLVLTQDGKIAKKLIGQDSPIEKEYLVRVEGNVEPYKIEQLEYGLILDDKELKRAQVDQIDTHFLRIVLSEGKKRQIRRMCELVNLNVTSIKRVRIGKVKLGSLKPGCWRYLEADESF
ncbi:MAG: putative RNA pseudouridine synthase [Chlamydiae bacterium]|nr:putative RNA pseudouridine synthase [Chlamydiota bacterium]